MFYLAFSIIFVCFFRHALLIYVTEHFGVRTREKGKDVYSNTFAYFVKNNEFRAQKWRRQELKNVLMATFFEILFSCFMGINVMDGVSKINTCNVLA